MKIYEFSIKYKMLFDEIANQGGEITEDQLRSLKELDTNFHTAILNTCALLKSLEYEQLSIDDAINKMRKRSVSLQNKVRSLKNYILNVMKDNGIKQISDEYHKILIRKCPPHLDITDSVPEEYLTHVTSVNKEKITHDLNNGKELTFAQLNSRETLSIK